MHFLKATVLDRSATFICPDSVCACVRMCVYMCVCVCAYRPAHYSSIRKAATVRVETRSNNKADSSFPAITHQTPIWNA